MKTPIFKSQEIKVPLSEVTKTVKTVDGEELKLVDIKSQCGFGDCLCTFGFVRKAEDQDQEKGLITVTVCQHHVEEGDRNGEW